MIFPTDYNSSIPFALTSLGNLTVGGVTSLNCTFAAVDSSACDAGSYVLITIPNLRAPLTPGSILSWLFRGNTYDVLIGGGYVNREFITAYNSSTIQITLPTIYDRNRWLSVTVTVGEAAVVIPNAIFIGSLLSSSSAAAATVRSSSGRSSSTGGTSSSFRTSSSRFSSSSQFSSSSFITSSSSQFSSSSSSTGAGGDIVIGGDISINGCLSKSVGGQLQGCQMCDVLVITTTDYFSVSSSTSIGIGTDDYSYDCKIIQKTNRDIRCYFPNTYGYSNGAVMNVNIRNGVSGLSSYTIRRALVSAPISGGSNLGKTCGSSQDDYVAGGGSGDFSSSSNSLGTTLLIIIIVAVVVGILILLSVILCSLWCCCGLSVSCVTCCVKAHQNKQKHQQQQQPPQQQQNGQFLGGDVLSSDASDIELTTSSSSSTIDVNNNERLEGETA